jgi:hypothetical protein
MGTASLPFLPEPATSRIYSAIRTLFSFPAMLVSGLVFLTFWGAAGRFDDPDLWWHLRLGQTIWDSGRIPNSDQFSFTAHGHDWVAHEWLSQVLLYLTYRAGGYPAMVLWLCVVASLIVGLAYLLCVAWSGNWKVSALGGMLTLFMLTVSLAIRPLLLGHLFLMVELLLLHAGIVRQSRWIWALPPLFIVWTNCHGSFLFGLALLAGVLLTQCVEWQGIRPRLKLDRHHSRLPLVFALTLAAPFVNPIGPALVLSPFNVLLKQPDNIGNVEEWAALTIQDPRGLGLVLVVIAIVALALSRRKVMPWPAWLLLAGVTGMALQHSRMLPIFGFVAAPVLCFFLADYWENYHRERDLPGMNALLMLVAAAGCVMLLPGDVDLNRQLRANEPVVALEAIEAKALQGPMLNDYAWGGYLLWARPSRPVFIDGRADIYAWTGVLREYGRWATLKDDPRGLLDKYSIEICLLPVTAPMAHVLPLMSDWKLEYADNLAVVYTRRKAQAASLRQR